MTQAVIANRSRKQRWADKSISLREALLDAVDPADVREIVAKIMEAAKSGDCKTGMEFLKLMFAGDALPRVLPDAEVARRYDLHAAKEGGAELPEIA